MLVTYNILTRKSSRNQLLSTLKFQTFLGVMKIKISSAIINKYISKSVVRRSPVPRCSHTPHQYYYSGCKQDELVLHTAAIYLGRLTFNPEYDIETCDINI